MPWAYMLTGISVSQHQVHFQRNPNYSVSKMSCPEIVAVFNCILFLNAKSKIRKWMKVN